MTSTGAPPAPPYPPAPPRAAIAHARPPRAPASPLAFPPLTEQPWFRWRRRCVAADHDDGQGRGRDAHRDAALQRPRPALRPAQGARRPSAPNTLRQSGGWPSAAAILLTRSARGCAAGGGATPGAHRRCEPGGRDRARHAQAARVRPPASPACALLCFALATVLREAESEPSASCAGMRSRAPRCRRWPRPPPRRANPPPAPAPPRAAPAAAPT